MRIYAAEMGFVLGHLLGLTHGWGIFSHITDGQFFNAVKTTKPYISICSLPCTMIGVLQRSTSHIHCDEESWVAVVGERLKLAVQHISSCVRLYTLQMANGRRIMHERPGIAKSWGSASVRYVLRVVVS